MESLEHILKDCSRGGNKMSIEGGVMGCNLTEGVGYKVQM